MIWLTNVRFGSASDINSVTHLRPLLGVKQTLDVRFPVQHDPTMSKPGSGKEPTSRPLQLGMLTTRSNHRVDTALKTRYRTDTATSTPDLSSSWRKSLAHQNVCIG